jgi:octaprenyl-diphosphate synthase
VQRCGALDYTRAQAQRYHDQALESLGKLPPSAALSAMEQITDLSINRDH